MQRSSDSDRRARGGARQGAGRDRQPGKIPDRDHRLARSRARAAGPFAMRRLSSGLDLVRKCLGQHEIATVQATAIDQRQRA